MHSNSPAPLTLTLLGGFSARVGDTELSLPTRKSRALLAYLGLSAGHPEPREKLCALFWRDTRREQARQSLRQTLFSIRRALPEPAAHLLVSSSRTVMLHREGTRVDVHDLERHASHRSPSGLERVARIYAGPLLDGMCIDEAPFDEWLAGERRRLSELTVSALAHLAAAQAGAGALDDSLQTRLLVSRLEPLGEANHRAILELYLRQGRRATALEHYRALAAALPRGTSLEPATVALYDAMAVPSMAPPQGGDPSSLVGRARELSTLRATLAEAWAGRGRVAVVTGEAGAGKTRLLDELEAEAARHGGRVVRGRAYESEQILPFAMWMDALRSENVLTDDGLLRELSAAHRTELERLSPRGDARPTDTPSSAPALRLFEAVTALLSALSGRQPLGLLFDDLQWADEMSLRLLAYAGRHLAGARAFVACTARREELGRAPFLPAMLRELARDERLMEVSVHPLSEEDTGVLARKLASGDIGAALERRVWQVSEGNPFVIVESMRAIAGGAPLEGVGCLPVPERVREVVSVHVGRLAPLDRELTEVAAVIGREFDFALLAAAAGGDTVDAAAAVERLVQGYVLAARGSDFYFTHDRIREVVYGGLLPVKRAVLHGSVARALERVRASSLDLVCDQLALHFGRAGEAASAIRYLIRFTQNAARAFGLEESLVALAEARALLDRVPPAERAPYAVEIAVRQANCLAYLGRFVEIEPCLSPHEPALEGLNRPDLTAHFYFWMGFNHSLMGHRKEARAYIGVSLEAAESAGDAVTLQRAHGLLAWEYANSGEYREGIRHGRMATADPLVPEPEYLALAWMNLGINHVFVGELATALSAFENARRIADAAGVARVACFVTGYSGYTLVQMGHVEAGLARCEMALTMGADPLSTSSSYVALASAQAEGGAPDAALAVLPNLAETFRLFRMKPSEALVILVTAMAHLAKGQHESAISSANEAIAAAVECGNPRNVGRALGVRGEAELALGDVDRAATSLDESQSILSRIEALYDLGITLCARAALERQRGDEARALRVLEDAERLYVHLGLPIPAARVRARMARGIEDRDR